MNLQETAKRQSLSAYMPARGRQKQENVAI